MEYHQKSKIHGKSGTYQLFDIRDKKIIIIVHKNEFSWGEGFLVQKVGIQSADMISP